MESSSRYEQASIITVDNLHTIAQSIMVFDQLYSRCLVTLARYGSLLIKVKKKIVRELQRIILALRQTCLIRSAAI